MASLVNGEPWSSVLKVYYNKFDVFNPFGVTKESFVLDTDTGCYPLPTTKLVYRGSLQTAKLGGVSFFGNAGYVNVTAYVAIGSNWEGDKVTGRGEFKNIIIKHKWEMRVLWTEIFGIPAFNGVELLGLYQYDKNSEGVKWALIEDYDIGNQTFYKRLCSGGAGVGVPGDIYLGEITPKYFIQEGDFPEDTGIAFFTISSGTNNYTSGMTLRTYLSPPTRYFFTLHEPITGFTDYYYDNNKAIWKARSKTLFAQKDFTATGMQNQLIYNNQFFPTATILSDAYSNGQLITNISGDNKLIYYKNGTNKGIYTTPVLYKTTDNLDEYFGEETSVLPNATNPVSYYDNLTGILYVFGYLNNKIYCTSTKDYGVTWSTPKVVAPRTDTTLNPQIVSIYTIPSGGIYITYIDKDKQMVNDTIDIFSVTEEPADEQKTKALGDSKIEMVVYNDTLTKVYLAVGAVNGDIYINASRDNITWAKNKMNVTANKSNITSSSVYLPNQSPHIYKKDQTKEDTPNQENKDETTNVTSTLTISYMDADSNWYSKDINITDKGSKGVFYETTQFKGI